MGPRFRRLRRGRSQSPPLKLTRSEAGHEAILLFQDGVGLLSLQVRALANDSSPLPMVQRTAIWKPLLTEFYSQHGRRPSYLLAVGDYTELNTRLAATAACSDTWNSKAGRPMTGAAGSTVADLLSDGRPYAELSDLFSPLAYRVSIHSVESVLTCLWRDLPYAASEVDCDRVSRGDLGGGASV